MSDRLPLPHASRFPQGRMDPGWDAQRHRRLRQLVREGKLTLDDYLRVWVGVHDDYIEQARPRFEKEIFHH